MNAPHNTRTFKSGNSVAVRLPKGFGIAAGAAVALERRGREVVIRRIADPVADKAAIEALTGLAPFVAPRERWHAQLGVARLPQATDVDDLKRRLYDDHAIEVPVYRWQDQPLIRVSCQVYNTAADIEALTSALRQLVPVQA